MRVTLDPKYTLTEYSDGQYCAETENCERIPLSKGEAVCLYASPDSELFQDNIFYQRLVKKGLLKEGTGDPDCRKCKYVYRRAVQIAITSRCNCKCLHCYAADENGNSSGEFSMEQINHILDQCQSIGIDTVELTGGEPLLHKNFPEILEEIQKRKMHLRAIHTNGLLIDEALLAKLRQCGLNPKFTVSFDGLGTHDEFRGVPGCEEKVLSKTDLLKREGFSYRCNINVNKLTSPRLVETARFLAVEKQADLLLVFTAPTPRWQAAGKSLGLSYEEYFDNILEVITASHKEKWGRNLKSLFVPDIPADENVDFSVWHRSIKVNLSARSMDFCRKAAEMIYIGHDGRVLSCNGFEAASLALGYYKEDIDIFKNDLSDILSTSSYLDPYKITLQDIINKEEKCGTCRWLVYCHGGCRMFSALKRWDSISEANCVFFSGGYAEKLEKIFRRCQREPSPVTPVAKLSARTVPGDTR